MSYFQANTTGPDITGSIRAIQKDFRTEPNNAYTYWAQLNEALIGHGGIYQQTFTGQDLINAAQNPKLNGNVRSVLFAAGNRLQEMGVSATREELKAWTMRGDKTEADAHVYAAEVGFLEDFVCAAKNPAANGVLPVTSNGDVSYTTIAAILHDLDQERGQATGQYYGHQLPSCAFAEAAERLCQNPDPKTQHYAMALKTLERQAQLYEANGRCMTFSDLGRQAYQLGADRWISAVPAQQNPAETQLMFSNTIYPIVQKNNQLMFQHFTKQYQQQTGNYCAQPTPQTFYNYHNFLAQQSFLF